MTEAEIEYQAAQFHKEFKALVRKYAPVFEAADPRLLTAMASKCSVFNSYVWLDTPKT